MHVVVVLWCSADGGLQDPGGAPAVAAKRSCAPGAYQTKLQLAAQLLTELVAARLPFQYLVMDTHDTAGWFTRLAGRLGICWVGTCHPRPRSSGAAAASQPPSWPSGCGWPGVHGWGCARPPSRSTHPPTARCGWS